MYQAISGIRKKYLVIIVLIGVIAAFLSPTPGAAASTTCYMVSSAGIPAVNGMYTQVGTYNSRPAYKHESKNYFISYDAHGYGNEWNLTTAIGGGNDLYYKIGSTSAVPEGTWSLGFNGTAPSPQITSVTCPFEPDPIITVSFPIEAGQSKDGHAGNIGVYTPSSCYSGSANITKLPASEISPFAVSKIDLHSYILSAEISDLDGKEKSSFCGYYYLYFNLTSQNKTLWETGELGVYEYLDKEWIPIPSYFVDAGEHGRLTFLISHPGKYALGVLK